MWVDRRKRIVIRNILIAIVLIALIYGLAITVMSIVQKNSEEDAQLMKAYEEQKKQQTALRKEQSEQVDIEYKKDLETIEQYVPGIICWGDVLTSGTSGNVSYPDVLQKYINAAICDIYDISASLDKNAGLSRVEWEKYTVDIPVLNMGGGEENTLTVLGRSGVVPFVVGKDFVIPAGTEKIEIEVTAQNGQPVMPLIGGSAGVNNVVINGIEGVLSVETDAQKYVSYSYYYFNRIEKGTETAITAGTPIITDATDKYKDYIHVVCIGTYGGFTDTNELIDQIRAMLSRQNVNSDRYIVIGLCSTENKWYYNSNYFDIMDSAMKQAFGDRYINIRKYLCTDALTDAKMTITKEDRNKVLYGVIPDAFVSNSSNGELTAVAYQLLGKLVFDRMDKLGYFDEVKKELKTDVLLENILRDDPNYLINKMFN